MALLDLWKSKPTEYGKKRIQQLVGIAGEGSLKDGSDTSRELRALMGAVDSLQLGRYLSECLDGGFEDSGLVLQDIVNELGVRLDCKVQHGLYRGKSGQIGYDGIWTFPDGYSLVVEVKTTDAYAINLDTIADYRKQLIQAGKISDQSSVLIVVGRKDTGGLEAQVRGSRHAWDMRLISADKLFQLVTIKESAEDKATIAKIRSVLRPVELTRLDFVVDLLVSTAADIQESTKQPDEEPAPAKETREKKFTPVAFNDEVAKRIAISLKTTLKKATRSLYESTEQSLSVRALVSRTYESGDEKGFWYAFHPNYGDALKDYKKSFVAFGCGSPERILLFPLETFVTWLKDLNMTRDEEREYYHVRLGFSGDGHVRLHRKDRKPAVDVTQYVLKHP